MNTVNDKLDNGQAEGIAQLVKWPLQKRDDLSFIPAPAPIDMHIHIHLPAWAYRTFTVTGGQRYSKDGRKLLLAHMGLSVKCR